MWASQSARPTFAGCAASGIKLPFTPSLAYFSRKKKSGGPDAALTSVLLVPFSVVVLTLDEKDDG